jgi:hypothetical protein
VPTARASVPALGDEIAAEARAEELERTCRRLQQQLAKAKAATSDLVDAVYAGAREAALITGQPKPVPAPKPKAGKGDPEWAVIHFSDWQLGKIAGSPGSQDFYDMDVCAKRVRYVVDRVRRITAIQRKDHPVPGCQILFGGDMVEGVAIFPGNAYEVDSTTYEQMMAASGLMAEVVLTLLQDFDEVRVASVHGNHGRFGRRGDYPREDNADHIAYALARAQLAGQDRLTWAENLHWFERVDIGNWTGVLAHGDQIKGWSGTPLAGLLRRGSAWSTSMGFEWSDLFVGHYHQRAILTLGNGAAVRMVASSESGNEYAAELGARGRPMQALVYVHPEKGVTTGEYPIWLD